MSAFEVGSEAAGNEDGSAVAERGEQVSLMEPMRISETLRGMQLYNDHLAPSRTMPTQTPATAAASGRTGAAAKNHNAVHCSNREDSRHGYDKCPDA